MMELERTTKDTEMEQYLGDTCVPEMEEPILK